MIPPWIDILLPLATVTVTGIFQHADARHPWAKVINALIASLFFIGAATIVFFLTGPLTGNFGFDALVYLTILGLLIKSPPCIQLYEAIRSVIPSPLKALFAFLDKNNETGEDEEDKPAAYLTRIDDATSTEISQNALTSKNQ
jgi:hypothetical protein